MPLGPITEQIKTTFGDKVRENEPLAPMTTYKIGGPADLLLIPEGVEDLQKLLAICTGHDVPITVLGGGSNLLIQDGGIRGITIWMNRGFRKLEKRIVDDRIFVTCGASRENSELLEFCIEHGIAGMEFASGVPGTVGGGIKGNAGTRDGAFGDVVYRLCYVNRNGKLIKKKREDLSFRYRGLEIDGRFIIVEAELLLKPGQGEKVREKRDKIIAWRKAKQPWEFPSAGSVFVNPDCGSAGRMVEQSGCKGMTIGGAQVSDCHANFIVNVGGATAADVLTLIDRVRRKVFDQFGVLLETEIQVVGEAK
jgi:UDP-N-acetylmuramate dehydrogenase